MRTEEERKKHAAAMREWRADNNEKYRAYQRQYAKENAAQRRVWNNKAYKKWREKYPFAQRFLCIKNEYGLSRERYEGLLLEQDNRCAICLTPFEKTPHVDHDHTSNEVRGLLCALCNHLIGEAKESIQVLRNAINYLRKHGVQMAHKKSHKYTHTHIEHHADNSHTVHHVHEDGPHKDSKHAVADHDSMIDSLMDHTSAPNPGESTEAAVPGAPATGMPAVGGPAGGAPPAQV
jgi:hypothetical protein